ncbi:pyruvate decarboxylase, putative [Perkinsus marinus ATCC 50983]|uniref:Pyruvate decarboxylase, putative n=1 Tax=Perkinsus marinus (strain ATCC 50983 / TXsc) TaxID=423536 RepID=C5L187_PERM5|nr:pyruvate decarboxylase, putative [Perkinsus marinus ATCC 50983]EER09494.1 pyruvate decarboxylase, putative [Perkinsus marinus ATCC 50983]|eukprot:XP_002777678.1 pyruvate decarboxylase, putative [Perkinsus marinus ATCC 50983]
MDAYTTEVCNEVMDSMEYTPGMSLDDMVTNAPCLGNMKCTDALVRCLEAEGVKYIFGIPGEENLDFLESIRVAEQEGRIKLILTRHEQAAGFMAATVGRLTGQPGVCLSTLGPGATNFSTAVAYAKLGGMPMLVLTGQKPIRHSKQGQFQIVDIVDHFRPITKSTNQVPDADAIPSLIRESVREALEEKPGPVHIELPEDIAGHTLGPNEYLFPIGEVRRPVPDAKAIAKAVALIHAAKRPLLCIGSGCNRKQTSKMLRRIIDETGIYAVSTQMGKGVVDETSPHFLGALALSQNDWVHTAVDWADLIVNIGHDSVEKPPFFMKHNNKPIVIHVNFYPAVVDEVYFPHHEVVGDIGNAVWQITETLKSMPKPHWDFAVFEKIREVAQRRMHHSIYTTSDAFPMDIRRVVKDIRNCMPEKSVVCLDNGMYKIWFARLYEAREPNTLLLDNALASMGAGLPSALAAKMVRPDHKVVAVSGDGGFMMNSQELETAVTLGLDVIQIVLNDNAFGMIEWKQSASRMPKWGLQLNNVDFVKYAEAYGAKGYRVTRADELTVILNKCLDEHGVHLIEVPVNYEASNRTLNVDVPDHVRELREILNKEFEY